MATLLEKNPSSSHFFFHRDQIEQEIAKSIGSLGEKNKLRDACEYALKSRGKRLRPLIVLLVAEALGSNLNVMEAALSVEYFHTASLIVDDLPCMDNAEERREKPTLHKVFGETVAVLASYSLITAAFEKIYRNAELLRASPPPYCAYSDRVCALALEAASACAGIRGATGGQFLDMFPPVVSLDMVKQVIYKKTITLFEVCFLFGWLFGGGELPRLDEVKKVAWHLGMAFQIADDMHDLSQDEKSQKEMSIVSLIGKERSLALFDEEMRRFYAQLTLLKLDTPSFEKMGAMLLKSVLAHR